LRKVEGSQRDSTQDWLLPRGAAPPLLAELELRIDEALVTARASEQAVGVVGEAAIDAAKQARRAADLAEQASANALAASRAAAAAAPSAAVGSSVPPAPVPAGAPETTFQALPHLEPEYQGDASLRSFSERADRVAARLRALERRPRWGGPSSAAAGRRRPGG
jgi:hypothetical protein